MMNIHESTPSVPESDQTTQTRSMRRLAVGAGVAAALGLTAAVGVGLATQSPQLASAAPEPAIVSPMGAQLPWDDSTSSDNPLANNDGTRSAADGRRAGRMGDMRDHGGRHMRDGDRPGAGQGRIGRAIAGPRELVVLAAEKLGMSVADLIDDVRSGKSIADIAGEKNVDVQDVIDALVDEVVQGATEMISDLVNRRIPIPQNSPES